LTQPAADHVYFIRFPFFWHRASMTTEAGSSDVGRPRSCLAGGF